MNGATGTDYTTPLVLVGTLSATGYFVVAQDANLVVAPTSNSMISAKAEMQNGPDNVQLVLANNVVDAVGYGDFSGAATFAGEGSAAPPAANTLQSLSRLPNGADSGNNAVDFDLGTATPGAANLP